MKVAIMQPTYLPWLGYFSLMARADQFILLDSVQFSYQSWQQYNQIKGTQGAIKLTIPVLVRSKGRRSLKINQVLLDLSKRPIFPEKHIRAIEHNYSKTPYFQVYAPELFSIFRREYTHLSALTSNLIIWLRDVFNIKTNIIFSSHLKQAGSKADLIAGLCAEVGGDEYISPPGAKEYLELSDAFEKRGINIFYHQFNHPVYQQRYGDFLPYMSAIDALFNLGEGSLEVMKQGMQA